MRADDPAALSARIAQAIEDREQTKHNGALPAVGSANDITSPGFSDDALALEFVARYGVGLRWTAGFGWMRDAGPRWVRDVDCTRYACARIVCREAANCAPVVGEARRLASAQTVNATLVMAQSDPRIVTPTEAWDADPFALNTPAGVVDLRSGVMRQRTSADLFTLCTLVSPDSAMASPNFTRFVREVFGGDEATIEFMQRVLGYCLTGDQREQKLFFLHGDGANGKNTLLDLMLAIAADYGIKLPANVLMQSKLDRHPTEIAMLRGRRLAVSNELEKNATWGEALIKELTGDKYVSARFMRQDFFTFQMSQKHVVAGNYKPRVSGGDQAMARRMVLVPFEQSFKGREDKALPAKLLAEAPAVLAWMIDGARRWYENGLDIPATVTRASDEYLEEHDDLTLWLDECCDLGPHLTDSAADLYQAFSTWKLDRGEHAPSQTMWGQRVVKLPGVRRRKSAGVKYDGIRLRIDVRERLIAGRRR